MLDVLSRVQTPIKIPRLVLAPSFRQGEFDSHAVDGPVPFCHDGQYYMTYIGWDGIGYQTGLAGSADLVHWQKEGLIFGRGPRGSVTEYNAALTGILRDNELYGPGTLRRVDGRFVGVYHAYPRPGYEEGAAVIGLCWSEDLRRWEAGAPILYPQEGAAWERGGLYKAWLLEHGGIYYLFYNAKDRTEGAWVEQTGVATSRDLVHWERYPGNPVLPVGPQGAWDDHFASDPVVLRDRETWLLFYYGLSSDGHARDGVAASADLLHWTKVGPPLIDVGAPGSIDSLYAHKPGIITREGILYHFYCAVSPARDPKQGEIEYRQTRGIAVAHN